MTADADKGPTCLICDSKIANNRSSVKIFSQGSSSSEKPLADVISTLLEKQIEDDGGKSVVCKKCLKVVNEVSELQQRLATIKSDLKANLKKSPVKKVGESSAEEEYNDHDYLESFENHEIDSQPVQPAPKPVLKVKKGKNVTVKVTRSKKVVINDPDPDPEPEPEPAPEPVPEQQVIETVLVSETVEEHESGEALMDMDIESQFEEVHDSISEDSNVESEIITGDVTKDSVESGSETKKEVGRSKKSLVKSEQPNMNIEIVSKEDDEYTCLLCMTDELFKGDTKAIIAHMKDSHDTRLYICDVCGADFRKRNDLSFHLDEHVAKEEGDFQCEVCNRIFNNLRLFRIHKRVHFPQVKSWSCDSCNKKYSSKNLLDEHMNTHTGLRPYICEICGKNFASKYTFKAHSKIHEVRPRPFACTLCDKSFMSQQNLNQHERTHNGVKEYVCHQCGKAFGSPHNLEVHNIVHTGYKPFVCRVCGKAFARRAEIRDHERTHTGEKPYQCEHCGTTFSQRSNLQSHKRATHYNDKRYKCDQCGKGFKRRRLLDYHLKAIHTGERPYKCESCPSTFVYPEHFKKHMRIHTGEKPYLCEVCGKAFNSRDNRNAHRFIHSDKKPYECLVCGMGFMRKPLLYTHMQTQNHLNDTIVVNQPRLSTEEDQVITIPTGNVELQLGETEVYVTDLKDLKDHVIIQQGDEQLFAEGNVLNITTDGTVPKTEVRQIVVDGALNLEGGVMECKTEEADITEEVYLQEGEDGETIVINSTNADLSQLEGDGKNGVRLVQIRLPSNVFSYVQ